MSDHKARPRVYAGKPFAHFQWNYGWGVWEQVRPEAAGKRGVVTAYAADNVASETRAATAREGPPDVSDEVPGRPT